MHLTSGGGLVNLDFYARDSLRSNVELVLILQEGTFHQFHGGAMTEKSGKQLKEEINKLLSQYIEIRGNRFPSSSQALTLYWTHNCICIWEFEIFS